MKRKISLILVISVFIFAIAGCGNKKAETNVESDSGVVETNNDYMAKHIQSIEPENRDEFLYFWQSAVAYCKAVKLELKEIGNTNSYEFDPTDESQIPEELKSIDFSKLKRDNSKNLHKDFKLCIDGTNVELSFDGIDIYPTDYGYSDIEEIIEGLKSE